MADPFIDPEDLSDYIGIDVSADAGALIAIDAACDICRDVADQSFNQGTATLTLDGTGTDFLPLPRLPVVNAGTVNVGGTVVTDYAVDYERGALIRKLPDEGVDYWTTVAPVRSGVARRQTEHRRSPTSTATARRTCRGLSGWSLCTSRRGL